MEFTEKPSLGLKYIIAFGSLEHN